MDVHVHIDGLVLFSHDLLELLDRFHRPRPPLARRLRPPHDDAPLSHRNLHLAEANAPTGYVVLIPQDIHQLGLLLGGFGLRGLLRGLLRRREIGENAKVHLVHLRGIELAGGEPVQVELVVATLELLLVAVEVPIVEVSTRGQRRLRVVGVRVVVRSRSRNFVKIGDVGVGSLRGVVARVVARLIRAQARQHHRPFLHTCLAAATCGSMRAPRGVLRRCHLDADVTRL